MKDDRRINRSKVSKYFSYHFTYENLLLSDHRLRYQRYSFPLINKDEYFAKKSVAMEIYKKEEKRKLPLNKKKDEIRRRSDSFCSFTEELLNIVHKMYPKHLYNSVIYKYKDENKYYNSTLLLFQPETLLFS